MELQVVSIFDEILLLLGDLGEYLGLFTFIPLWLTLLKFCLSCCLRSLMGVLVFDGAGFILWSLLFMIYLWVLWLLTIRFNQEFVLFSNLLCQKLLWRSIEIYRSEVLIKRICIYDLGDEYSILVFQFVLKDKLFFDLGFFNTIFFRRFWLALDTFLTHILKSLLAFIWLLAKGLSFLIVESL